MAQENISFESELNELIRDIEDLQQKYQGSDQSFIDEINRIQQSEKPAEEKYKMIVDALEKNFNYQINKMLDKKSVGFFKRWKNAEHFIRDINLDIDHYHQTRSLALILQVVYDNHPEIAKSNIISLVFQVQYPVTYEPIPMHIRKEDQGRYQQLRDELKQYGFSESQIYRIYRGDDTINVKTVATYWPDLKKKYTLLDQEITDFIYHGITEKLIATASQNSLGINAVLAEPFPSYNPMDTKNIKDLRANTQIHLESIYKEIKALLNLQSLHPRDSFKSKPVPEAQ